MSLHHHIKRHKHLLLPFGLLLFVSGCTGAISKTAKDLGNQVAAPIVAPIEAGQKGMSTLREVDDRQQQENVQIEEIK